MGTCAPSKLLTLVSSLRGWLPRLALLLGAASSSSAWPSSPQPASSDTADSCVEFRNVFFSQALTNAYPFDVALEKPDVARGVCAFSIPGNSVASRRHAGHRDLQNLTMHSMILVQLSFVPKLRMQAVKHGRCARRKGTARAHTTRYNDESERPPHNNLLTCPIQSGSTSVLQVPGVSVAEAAPAVRSWTPDIVSILSSAYAHTSISIDTSVGIDQARFELFRWLETYCTCSASGPWTWRVLLLPGRTGTTTSRQTNPCALDLLFSHCMAGSGAAVRASGSTKPKGKPRKLGSDSVFDLIRKIVRKDSDWTQVWTMFHKRMLHPLHRSEEHHSILSATQESDVPHVRQLVQEQVEDVMLWCKALTGLATGVLWGVMPMEGAPAIISGLTAVGLASLMFLRMLATFDDEEFGGPATLIFHGVAPGGAMFLVRTALHCSALHCSAFGPALRRSSTAHSMGP